jgi:hypothetical protein
MPVPQGQITSSEGWNTPQPQAEESVQNTEENVQKSKKKKAVEE